MEFTYGLVSLCPVSGMNILNSMTLLESNIPFLDFFPSIFARNEMS